MRTSEYTIEDKKISAQQIQLRNSGILTITDNRSQFVCQRKLIDSIQRRQQNQVITDQRNYQTNTIGLPEQLKSGLENLSGYAMDDVNVHYNSAKPAQLNALAYAQGTDIHLGPGQEKHLPHEAWHVVQQKQGRVRPTMQLKGKTNINDDVGLEKEADVMGSILIKNQPLNNLTKPNDKNIAYKKGNELVKQPTIQRTVIVGEDHDSEQIDIDITNFDTNGDAVGDVVTHALHPSKLVASLIHFNEYRKLGDYFQSIKDHAKKGTLIEVIKTAQKINSGDHKQWGSENNIFKIENLKSDPYRIEIENTRIRSASILVRTLSLLQITLKDNDLLNESPYDIIIKQNGELMKEFTVELDKIPDLKPQWNKVEVELKQKVNKGSDLKSPLHTIAKRLIRKRFLTFSRCIMSLIEECYMETNFYSPIKNEFNIIKNNFIKAIAERYRLGNETKNKEVSSYLHAFSSLARTLTQLEGIKRYMFIFKEEENRNESLGFVVGTHHVEDIEHLKNTNELDQTIKELVNQLTLVKESDYKGNLSKDGEDLETNDEQIDISYGFDPSIGNVRHGFLKSS